MDKKKNAKILNKENIDEIVNKVQTLMATKLAITIFLIVQGIFFIINPSESLVGMSKSVSTYVFLATGTIIIGYFTSNKTNKINIKGIVIPILLFVLSIINYLFPKPFSTYIKLFLSLSIIVNALLNILNILNLNKLTDFINHLKNDIEENLSNEKLKDIKEGLEQESDKITNSISNITNQTSKTTYLFLIINGLMMIYGIYLIFFKSQIIVGMRAMGILLLISGLLDLPIAYKSFDISKYINIKRK